MTDVCVHDRVRLWKEGSVLRVELNRSVRHNSLDRDQVTALDAALTGLSFDNISALVFSAAGRNFSTGGDLQVFLDHAGTTERLSDYAARLVGRLHMVILKLLAVPVPVIARVQGMVTGGALGFLMASDLIVMADDAFIQPYYTEIGFGPDGGWTALLPERIGAARALAIQLQNQRLSARDALTIGLVDKIAPLAELDTVIEHLIHALMLKEPGSIKAAKRLIWNKERLATVTTRLNAETETFVEMICRPQVRDRMQAFVASLGQNRKGRDQTRTTT